MTIHLCIFGYRIYRYFTWYIRCIKAANPDSVRVARPETLTQSLFCLGLLNFLRAKWFEMRSHGKSLLKWCILKSLTLLAWMIQQSLMEIAWWNSDDPAILIPGCCWWHRWRRWHWILAPTKSTKSGLIEASEKDWNYMVISPSICWGSSVIFDFIRSFKSCDQQSVKAEVSAK